MTCVTDTTTNSNIFRNPKNKAHVFSVIMLDCSISGCRCCTMASRKQNVAYDERSFVCSSSSLYTIALMLTNSIGHFYSHQTIAFTMDPKDNDNLHYIICGHWYFPVDLHFASFAIHENYQAQNSASSNATHINF